MNADVATSAQTVQASAGMTSKNRKPDIFWLEGLLTLFNAQFPHGRDDPRRMGFNVGQQIVGLYLTEMLLKYALENAGVSHGQHHNLHELFRNLSRQRRRAVERQYTEILNSRQSWALDVAETVDSLLTYLGQNAITDTRYFWEPDRNHVGEHASILFAPEMHYPLIYALIIVLHNYPSKPTVKRYDTTFRSLAKAFGGRSDPNRPQSRSVTGKGRKPNIVWLEGLLDIFAAPFPHGRDDRRMIGFNVGQQIVGLYTTEMLLKYALENAGVSHGQHHNLHELFRELSDSNRCAVERQYTEILNSRQSWAWDVAETVDSLLTYLGQNPITDTRYFWETDRNHVGEHASILFVPEMLYPLIYALFIVLHNYPSKPIVKRYDTTFQSLAESFKQDQQRT